MCRMIAKVASIETSLLNEMLSCPHSLQYLSTQGRLPDNPRERGNHNDGCGMAFVKGNEIKIDKRTRENAWDESYCKLAKETQSTLFIAHNRLTSEGLEARIEGSHPFALEAHGISYAFSHNGTFYDFVEEAKQKNTSDSFILFQKLISTTENNSEEKIISRLKNLIKNYHYNSITGFLMSPDKLMVWRVFNESKKEKLGDYNLYYTLFMKLQKNAVVFSSEPLDDENWTLLPNMTCISAYPQNGSIALNYHSLQ